MGYPSFCAQNAAHGATSTNIHNNQSTAVNTTAIDESIATMKLYFYFYVTVPILIVGIIGNILNLVTLQAPTLRTVPFMYIRAMALFDLIALMLVLPACTKLAGFWPQHNYTLAFWQTHMEYTVLNTFLIASMYSAVVLTLQRYRMVCQPTRVRSVKHQRAKARKHITVVLVLAVALQTPLAAQFRVKEMQDGRFVRVDNYDVQCVEPWATLFVIYKYTRDGVRLFGVVALILLNIVIIRGLRAAGQRRRQLKASTLLGQRTRSTLSTTSERALVRSFTDNKVTVLMIAITVLYIVGNLPMMGLMLFHQDSYTHNYDYQLFRAIANLAEVLNHCLNFYVFCMASSDYSEAFFANCTPARRLCCACCPTVCWSNVRRNVSHRFLEGMSMYDQNNVEQISPYDGSSPCFKSTSSSPAVQRSNMDESSGGALVHFQTSITYRSCETLANNGSNAAPKETLAKIVITEENVETNNAEDVVL